MDSNTIEKLDKARYNAWLVQTIGFAILFGSLIFEAATGERSTGLLTAKIISFIFIFSGWANKRFVYQKIQKNDQVRHALNNELYTLYNYKSYVWGFWAALLAVGIILFLTDWRDINLNTALVCLIVGAAGGLTKVIANLIYYYRK